MFSNLRKRLEDSLDAVEALTVQQANASAPSNHVASPPEPAAPRRPGGMSLEERLRMKLAAAGATSPSNAEAPSSPSSVTSQAPARRTATPPPTNRLASSTPPQSPAARPASGTPPTKKTSLPSQAKETSQPAPQAKSTSDPPTTDPSQVALPQSPEPRPSLELSSSNYLSFSISPPEKPGPDEPPSVQPPELPTANDSSPLKRSESATSALAPTSEDPLTSTFSGESAPVPPAASSTPDTPEEPTSLESVPPTDLSTPTEEAFVKLTSPPKAASHEQPEPQDRNITPAIQSGLTIAGPPTPDATPEGRTSFDIPRRGSSSFNDDDVEKIRERLKLVEQRFSDVSKSFKRIQAEKVAADKVLKELTPLEGISDTEGLREHFKNVTMKNQMSLEEIKRLNNQISQHDGRIEDLRDTHRLESRSQTELIDSLRKQVSEAEALLMASSTTTSNIEATSAARQATIDQLTAELEKAKNIARDEEDKRTKAIALLKTLRQKLVKAEKDKEDLQKEQNEWKSDKEALIIEIGNGRAEVERVRAENEREVANLRSYFEREFAGVKEKYEKEASSKKAQFELDAITTKASHSKELAAKANRISQLEATVRALTSEKDGFFDQLQMRQAELESSQYQLEALTNENKDLQFRLREASERLTQLAEEAEGRMGREYSQPERPRPGPSRQSSSSSYTQTSSPAPVELARLLSETEGKYEARLSEMRTRLRSLEKERTEAEEEWSKNLGDRTKEVERLRQAMKEQEERIKAIQESSGRDAEWEEKERQLQRALQKATAQGKQLDDELAQARAQLAKVRESEGSLVEERTDARNRVAVMEKQLDEIKSRESQLKSANKTLREELRKVQSSAALLEKQRNPGVGYWSSSSRNTPDRPGSPGLQPNGGSSGPTSPRPITPVTSEAPVRSNSGTSNPEEEVNLEYLRNVILQFLEHKEMRPNLVRVLSIILHFTPQETRRLIAKV